MATGGTPTLTTKVIRSEAYGIPPGAEQKGAPSTLDSGDDRMQQTQFINGQIWGELTTAVTIPGDSAPRAGAAWFAVRPSLSNGTDQRRRDRPAGLRREEGQLRHLPGAAGRLGRAGRDGVHADRREPSFPSAAYAVLPSSATRSGRHRRGGRARARTTPNATRWGDYSFAVLDPSRDAVWLATEYVPPRASQTSNRQRNWGTRVFQVGLS